jgi:hypothetical protein
MEKHAQQFLFSKKKNNSIFGALKNLIMKKLLLFAVLLTSTILFSQRDDSKKPSNWKTTGKISFLMNQSSFSNWQPGGDNAFSGTASLNYDFNYTKNGWIFDNKLIANIGINTIEGEDTKKTDDRLELNSIIGKQISEFWNVSFFSNFKTQFLDGNDFSDDFDGKSKDFPTSGFMKPGYLSFGPGFFWKKSDNISVNIAPITSRFTFITGTIYTLNDGVFESSEAFETFGVKPGENMRYEFGLNLRAYYRTNLMENISIENILTVFSDYIDKPQNVDIDYTMNLVMKINDVFSTNLTVQGVYDDNAFQGLQIRQTFGVGISYVF